MGNRLTLPYPQIFNGTTGDFLSGGLLYFYLTGTTTPTDTYSDAALATPNSNPVTIDSAGRFGPIFLDPNVTYKVVLKDSAGSTIWTADPVVDPAANVTAAVQVYAGNPNGNLAGSAGSVGGSSASMVYDITNQLLYVCTTTGTASTAVWTQVAARLSGSIVKSSDITPATIGADQNDYAPTDADVSSVWRLQASAAYAITGIDADQVDGQELILVNIGTFNITLKNQNASSTAANRFITGDYRASGASTDGDVVLLPDYIAVIIYDGTTARWRLKSITALPDLGNHVYIRNGSIAASVNANILTLALKDAAGNDPSPASPVIAAFRSTTATNGGYSIRVVTSALSMTVSSGSTLGFGNSETNLLHAGLIDNAGTLELGVSNDGGVWTEDRVISTTAEGGAGAADSRSVIYSTTARASVACRLLAVMTIQTGATAGQWGSAPTRMSGVAGTRTSHKNGTRAWGQATGSGSALSDGFGISSITDNGTGDITFTFAVAMTATTSYSAQVSCERNGGTIAAINSVGTLTTAASRLINYNTSNNATDPGLWCFAAVGW